MPVIRHDRCLAALGADELLDLAGDPARDLWLDDSPCATCELGQLHDAIDQAAARANGLRAAFGLDPIVHRTTTESSTTPVDEPRPRVVDARHGAMSRRGLFRRLLGDVGARGGAPAAEAAVPPRRQRLLQRLRTWATEPKPSADAPVTSSLGFGDVRIDTDRCSACGLCATFCPTSALTLDITSRDPDLGTFTLSVRPASCLDCGLCSVACPSDAITVTPRIAAGAVTAGSSKTVATGRRIACEVCGTATAALTDGNGRCFSCLEGVVTPLRDEKGLMADLLGRIPQP